MQKKRLLHFTSKPSTNEDAKMRDGNVFSHVCLSFSSRGVPVQGPNSPSVQVLLANSSPSVQGLSPPAPTRPPDMFKLVHYEAQTVDKWVVGIQLKCLLVHYLFANNLLVTVNKQKVHSNLFLSALFLL